MPKQKRSNKRQRRARDNEFAPKRAQTTSIPRKIWIMPDRLVTDLSYYGRTSLTILTGEVTAARRWSPTKAYDIDPSIGSTPTAGYSEWAALYGSFRVISASAKFSAVSSSSTSGVSAVLLPLNIDPGSAPADSVVAEWPSNTYAKSKMLGFIGSPPTTLSMRMTTEKIFGSAMVRFDDNFSGLTSGTGPINNWFFAFGLIADSAVAAPLRVPYENNFVLRVEFFDRRSLSS